MRRTPFSFSMLFVCLVILAFQLDLTPAAAGAGSPQQGPTSAPAGPAGAAQSDLVTTCYKASRENEDESMRLLEAAKQSLAQNAQVGAKDPQGRTALHWVVIGAAYARKEKHRQAYVELTELLLSRNAEVNAEDEYGNTALDYEAGASTDEILPLLLDYGARNGAGQDEVAILGNLYKAVSSAAESGGLAQVRAALKSDLTPGAELQVRLTMPVGSHISRGGDPVEAVVIAPALAGGREVVSPGTKIQGTVALARRAIDEYQRAQLVLTFANLIGPGGEKTRLAARVTEVDNARETVEQGRIIGIPHPNNAKLTWGARLLGFTNPLLSYSMQAALLARDKELKREIEYQPGVEMTLTALAPARLAAVAKASMTPSLPVSPELAKLVRDSPLRTETPDKTPSDLTNFLFVGPQEKLEAAFKAAGWAEAEEVGLKSGLKTFIAVAEERGYKRGPVSLLEVNGEPPAFTYQKQNNTFARRHHIRFWPRPGSFMGQPVWVAAATHDIGIATRREGTQWIHRIDPHVDRERAKVMADLLFTGQVKAQALVERPAAPRQSENATGDKIETDGKMAALVLR